MDCKALKHVLGTNTTQNDKVCILRLNHNHYVLYDKEDYEKINRYKWHTIARNGVFYAETHIWKKGRIVSLLMHRFVMNTPNGLIPHHRNGNGLDNRKTNLRNCTPRQHRNEHKIKHLREEITCKNFIDNSK